MLDVHGEGGGCEGGVRVARVQSCGEGPLHCLEDGLDPGEAGRQAPSDPSVLPAPPGLPCPNGGEVHAMLDVHGEGGGREGGVRVAGVQACGEGLLHCPEDGLEPCGAERQALSDSSVPTLPAPPGLPCPTAELNAVVWSEPSTGGQQGIAVPARQVHDILSTAGVLLCVHGEPLRTDDVLEFLELRHANERRVLKRLILKDPYSCFSRSGGLISNRQWFSEQVQRDWPGLLQ